MEPETPTIVDEDAEEDDVVEEHENNADGDVVEAEVDVTGDDLGGDLFDGVETAKDSPEPETPDPDAEGEGEGDVEAEEDVEEDEPGEIAAGLSGNAAAMEEAINEGAARLSVVGLTDSDFEDSELSKDELEEEFQETFQAFRLGYFGSRSVERYFLEPADNDVAPIWGLLGSALIAGAMVVWLRPDGDQAVEKAREAVGNITGGGD